MGFFGAAYRWGEGGGGEGVGKKTFRKICHAYPTMMKPNTVIPYLKKIKKYINNMIIDIA